MASGTLTGLRVRQGRGSPMTRRAAQVARGGPARGYFRAVRTRTVAPAVGAVSRVALPGRFMLGAGRNTLQPHSSRQPLDVSRVLDLVGYVVTLGASEGAPYPALEMRLMRAHADRRARAVSGSVTRRRRIVTHPVARRAAPLGIVFDVPVHVQARGNELVLVVDHFTVTHRASLRLRMRQRGGEAVARATGCARAAGSIPNRVAVAMTVAARAAAGAQVVTR